ncbi:hypothetical protein KTO58_14255 [Chitinophaga pendula]|uniref:hypothetical protein n=1 Tax=Chitinophaga TaxID=79328 RepID=UPI000BAFFCAB|nr:MULTISPECIES: hypothetical protein [Chitinophaga]ASZ12099.1 hypothetical protein CK934_14580 [Chitinophaga sp. MD30]UCJ04865.1 hypothetical protein KTO58_14255 [Chitinophaga pendula]
MPFGFLQHCIDLLNSELFSVVISQDLLGGKTEVNVIAEASEERTTFRKNSPLRTQRRSSIADIVKVIFDSINYASLASSVYRHRLKLRRPINRKTSDKIEEAASSHHWL